MRRLLLASLLAASALGYDRGPEETKAIEALTKAGAAVIIDDGDPDKPALRMTFGGDRATDAELGALPALTRLRRLDLSGSKITDAGMVNLKGLFKLQKLYLHDAAITDAGLASLKELDRLEVLDLSKTKVTDAGLPRLADLQKLRLLDLSETGVTAEGFESLKKLADLQELHVRGLKPADDKQAAAFEDKVLDLQKALPQLKVVR